MTTSPTLKIRLGSEVIYQDKRCTIKQIIDLEHLVVIDNATQNSYTVKIHELSPMNLTQPINKDLMEINDKSWSKAQQRLNAISSLIQFPHRNRQIVTARAKELGLDTATLYRWIKQYTDSQTLTALIPQGRADKGKTRLEPAVAKLVSSVIDSHYLTLQRKSVQKVFEEVKKQCFEQSLQAPALSTVRRMIDKISPELKLSKRSGLKEAKEQLSPHKGSFPNADFPLSVVQIDHTKLDIILVDDYHRRPIGRPWITLAIDVFSRMVMGFYISFDPPSALSTGLCLAHGILAKDKWLEKYPTNETWPLWGLPKKIHMDNAKEFRGRVLQRACQQYGIDIEWRPVARPNFGAHIERLLGSFATEIHTLPGTTFSNIQQRKGYDSEQHAVFTLSDFEKWLTTYIVDVHHQKIHSSLGMKPIDRFKEGVFGTKNRLGSGIPPKITDETTLRLNFLPYEYRTVQQYGVAINDIHYWHDVLRPWIGAVEPENKKLKRKFTFRRDPRDISVIWFFDPELKTYYAIPYRDGSHPVMSIWELREIKKHLELLGKRNIDEHAIFEAFDRLQNIQEEAEGKTKAARRATQRKIHHTPVIKTNPTQNPSPTPMSDASEINTNIKPFDELDDLS